MKNIVLFLLGILLVACSRDATVGLSDYMQGARYLQGIGVEKNEQKAVEYLTRASDLGNAKAQVALGYLYLRGAGVEKDETIAMKLFRRAAEQGERDAQYNTGLAYVRGIGTEKDLPEAFMWFTKAALQDDGGSQFNLGLMYLNGEGVVKDPLLAFAWFSIAAENAYEGAKGTREFARQALSSEQLGEAQGVIDDIKKRIKKPRPEALSSDIENPDQPL